VLGGTPRVVRLVWDAHRGFTAALVAINAAQGLVPLAQVWITKLIVDAVAAAAAGIQTPAGGIGAAGAAGVAPFVLALLALQGLVALASQALEPANQLVQQELSDRVSRDVTVRVLRKANGLADISYFESPHFHDQLQRAQQGANWRPPGMLNQLGAMLRAAIGLVSMLGVLLAFQPLLALAVVALALPNVIVQFRHQRQNWGMNAIEVPEVRLMSYFRNLLASKEHAKEIRLFSLGDFFLGRYLELYEAYYRRHRGLRYGQWRANTALAGLAAAGTTGAYAFVVLQALAGRITLGSLTLYLSAVNQVQAGLSTMIFQIASLYESNLFVGHLFEFLELEPAMALPPPERAQPVPVPLRRGIEFRHVAFRYPGTERLVLEDVSFVITPGQTVALVGANGAGKTTLVKLLTRLYDPTAGQVLLDGVDLREFDLEAWRRQIGVAFQDFAQYHLVARENIGVGQVERIGDLAAIQAAAARGGADSVVARLPDGYETILGRMFWSISTYLRTVRVEEGVDLSGGEWQKVALARAFMRTNGADGTTEAGGATGANSTTAGAGSDNGGNGTPAPQAQLLILDEPTAALDAEAEYQIYLRFHELTRGKATFLISHRFSTVKMADHILVLEDGRIAEQGSHPELVALRGRYAALYEMQAERYR
jgi:ATP-binding cassette subfamily B protein